MNRPPYWPDYCAHCQTNAYRDRIAALESEGLTTSDAQGVADAQWIEAWTFDLGRKVFLAAERAACVDYSVLLPEHLAAALHYGETQSVLWGRGRKLLRALQSERKRREATS